MKIPLGVQREAETGKQAENRQLTAWISASKKGDWEARKQLARAFAPLLQKLADKRAGGDTATRNQLMNQGREGLETAARKFDLRNGPQHFRIFALEYIEKAMDSPKRRGLLTRWFGRK